MKQNQSRYTVYEDNIIIAEHNKGPGYLKRAAAIINRKEDSIRNRVMKLRKQNKIKATINGEFYVYLVTTIGCQACVIQDNILNNLNIKLKYKFNYIKCNFLDVPTFIKINVKLEDYPVTIIVKDNTIKYHFSGTKSMREIEQLFKDLKL